MEQHTRFVISCILPWRIGLAQGFELPFGAKVPTKGSLIVQRTVHSQTGAETDEPASL
jgi:hypothetical protein